MKPELQTTYSDTLYMCIYTHTCLWLLFSCLYVLYLFASHLFKIFVFGMVSCGSKGKRGEVAHAGEPYAV